MLVVAVSSVEKGVSIASGFGRVLNIQRHFDAASVLCVSSAIEKECPRGSRIFICQNDNISSSCRLSVDLLFRYGFDAEKFGVREWGLVCDWSRVTGVESKTVSAMVNHSARGVIIATQVSIARQLLNPHLVRRFNEITFAFVEISTSGIFQPDFGCNGGR
jgi:hypothetical protein